MGKVCVGAVYGPMMAGKSSLVIEMCRAWGKGAVCINHTLDQRYGFGDGVMVTHDRATMECVSVDRLVPLVSSWSTKEDQPSLMVVNEVHFFDVDDLVSFVLSLSSGWGAKRKHDLWIVLTGLDLDFLLKPFPWFTRVASFLSWRWVLAARCTEPNCDRPATVTMRTVSSNERILVGGSTMYRPTCLKHHTCPL